MSSLSYFIENGHGRKAEVVLERYREGETSGNNAVSISEDDFMVTFFFEDEVTAAKVFQYIRKAVTFSIETD